MADSRFDTAGPDRQPGQDGLVVNFATPSDSAWTGALDALCRALPE
jgi:GntR family transcriptional regulator/MocR family aminotransferase